MVNVETGIGGEEQGKIARRSMELRSAVQGWQPHRVGGFLGKGIGEGGPRAKPATQFDLCIAKHRDAFQTCSDGTYYQIRKNLCQERYAVFGHKWEEYQQRK